MCNGKKNTNEAQIVFIHKPGKGKSKAEAFRQISRLNLDYKIVASIYSKREVNQVWLDFCVQRPKRTDKEQMYERQYLKGNKHD